MANWISSKLKAAENILQQIDQQAAESLRKNEKPRSDDLNLQTPTKISETVPLKDQLKKKAPENIDLIGKLHSDHNLSVLYHNNNHNYTGVGAKDVASVSVSANSNPKSTRGLTDSDWTELLSVPTKNNSSPLGVNLNGGLSGIRSLKKDGRRQGSSGSNSPALEGRRSQKGQNNALNSLKKSKVGLESKANGGDVDARPSNGKDSKFPDSTPRTSSVELQSDAEHLNRIHKRELERKDGNGNVVVERKTEGSGLNKTGNGKLQTEGSLSDGNMHCTVEKSPSLVPAAVDGASNVKTEVYDGHKTLKNGTVGINKSSVVRKNSLSPKRDTSLGSDEVSDSETDSASTSDSESEHEREERRKRREQILAQRAAAKANEAIKERENMVARLEGEKQSLEKILEEQAKQQAQEASELQTTMMEVMEAVEMEKQKHNHTRMEALARLAKLETANADLAKALANTQWNLEVEVNRVMELRQQMELKEAAHEELRRKISSTHQTGNKLVASKGVEFEHEILEAECSFISEKVRYLQEKAKTLETSIEMTQKDIENPTEVEIELKRRLNLLTDHLIQKQAQVEALSSEKATIQFRIEAVSRLLDENKSADCLTSSSRNDLKSGIWEYRNSKLRPLFEAKIQSGQQHLGSLVRQLDSIFCAGAVFLRRNSTARMWSFVYFVCLHIWVMYILVSHTPASDGARSGAVFSLENINYTGGV